jgi:hypothetical protein
LLNAETVVGAGDAAEPACASVRAPKPLSGFDDDDDDDDDDGRGEVSDWMASSALEAAPSAKNMAEAPNGREIWLRGPTVGQQASCHGK